MYNVDINLLGALLGAITDKLTNLYPEIGLAYQLYWATGCRRDEALDDSRWAYDGIDTITLTPLKGNSERSFLASALPTNFANHIIAGTNPFPTVRSGKIDYMFKQYILQTLWLTDKRLQSHAFRHMYCKRLYALGYSYDDIRIELGETNVSVAMGYVDSLIQTPSNTFKPIQYQTAQNSIFQSGSTSSLSINGNITMISYYGDDTYNGANYLVNGDNYIFLEHTFNSDYASPVNKTISIYFNQPLLLGDVDIRGIVSELPALDCLTNIFNINGYTGYDVYYSSMANLVSVQCYIKEFYFRYPFDLSQPVSIRDFPSYLFSNVLKSFRVTRSYSGQNPSVSWFSAISSCLALENLQVDREDFTTSGINLTLLTNLHYYRISRTDYPSGNLESTIYYCSSLFQINVTHCNLVNWDVFGLNVDLQYLYISDNASLTTSFPSTLSCATNMSYFDFRGDFLTVTRIDLIIESIFDFLDLNADITGVNGHYRDASCELSGANATPSGSYMAPSGFSLNVSNGSPANAQEFRYCVQMNYGWLMLVN